MHNFIPLARASDEDLLLRFCSGQKEAFSVLVKRYEKELYGYLKQYLGDENLAEDVFQTTFVQVFAKAGTFDPTRKVRPWLYAIATNQAIDLMRQLGRRNAVSIDQEFASNQGKRKSLLDTLRSDQPEPLQHVATAELQEYVRATIDSLPQHSRDVVILAYFQGLPYADIAEVLGIPLGTVKSRLHTAMLKLHQAWTSSTALSEYS